MDEDIYKATLRRPKKPVERSICFSLSEYFVTACLLLLGGLLTLDLATILVCDIIETIHSLG